ncbi:hypothetical protein DFH06DRAFT_1341416 [Mycena polygramma]|nr:hypothetical protein DFH06DRAFT_1341416 [Mycena polygramma]
MHLSSPQGVLLLPVSTTRWTVRIHSSQSSLTYPARCICGRRCPMRSCMRPSLDAFISLRRLQYNRMPHIMPCAVIYIRSPPRASPFSTDTNRTNSCTLTPVGVFPPYASRRRSSLPSRIAASSQSGTRSRPALVQDHTGYAAGLALHLAVRAAPSGPSPSPFSNSLLRRRGACVPAACAPHAPRATFPKTAREVLVLRNRFVRLEHTCPLAFRALASCPVASMRVAVRLGRSCLVCVGGGEGGAGKVGGVPAGSSSA